MPCRNTRVERRFAHEGVPRHDHARDPEEQDLGAGDEHVGRDRTRAGPRTPHRASRAWRAATATRRTRCRARPRPDAHGPPHAAHSLRSSRARDELRADPALAQYQTGMRWPHQSCREMFQSRMFSSQLTYTPSYRSGRMRSLPSRSASSALLRRAAPCARTTDPRAAARPPCRSDSSAAPRAGASRSSRAIPRLRAASTMRRSGFESVEPAQRVGHAAPGIGHLAHQSASRRSRPASRGRGACPTSKSFASCAGVIFTDSRCRMRDPYSCRRSPGSRRPPLGRRTPNRPTSVAIASRRPGVPRRRRRRAWSRGASSRPLSPSAVIVDERIPDVVELPACVLELRFLVAERGEAARAPVDDAVAAVHEAALVQAGRTPRAPRARARGRACRPCASSRSSQPIARSCRRIVPPVSSTNAATRATNASRPMSKRVCPSLASKRSTTFCVAMPA
jgi:hypothetical protein